MKSNNLLLTFLLIPLSSISANEIQWGGHVRVNYDHRDWVSKQDRDRFEFESLKLTIKGESGPFKMKADYRWYENVDMDVIKYADVTYSFNEDTSVIAGITKVPFGLLPVVSNTFWFSINYYLGLEDDYDAGVTVQKINNSWQFYGGYFFNDEYNKPESFERFSFDVADHESYRNKENGQFNIQVNRQWQHRQSSSTLLGISYQYGDILNLDTQKNGKHWAYDIHIEHKHGTFSMQLEYAEYEYDLTYPDQVSDDRLALSAFNDAFLIASKGSSIVANIAYKLPYSNDTIESVTCYSDYGKVQGRGINGANSIQWANGCVLGLGKLFIYLDNVSGKNMWFSGGSGIGLNFNDDEWGNRVNINFGYYF